MSSKAETKEKTNSGGTITWYESTKYEDAGRSPAVAINDFQDIFEVHATSNILKFGLFYFAGTVDRDKVDFGSSHDYDEGTSPNIAVRGNGLAVEVHNAPTGYDLWYRLGFLFLNDKNNRHIMWGTSVKYGTGRSPAVAINADDVAVEVHASENVNNLWYHVGKANPTTQRVEWGSSIKYDLGGNSPSVAINQAGVVVGMHEGSGHLWYRVGLVNAQAKTIDWGSSHKYDTGDVPSIAINEAGRVVEVHQSETANRIYYNTGTVDANAKTITWGASKKYDDGQSPRVAINNGGLIVEVHETDSATNSALWSRVGTFS